MRKRLFEVIEVGAPEDKLSTLYDSAMMIVIIASLLPLTFKETNDAFKTIEVISTVIFILDYIARWATADYKLNKGFFSFVVYPFTFMAIIDLVAVLPAFSLLASGFKMLKLFRLLRAFRVFRIFKMFRYSKSLAIIVDVIRDQKEPLSAVCILAVVYILICALVIFNVEPDTFDDFFEAIYWATISLTTMGYGDIYPVSTVGRIVTMLSSFFGIAIVALPAGIITAGYMSRIDVSDEEDSENDSEKKEKRIGRFIYY